MAKKKQVLYSTQKEEQLIREYYLDFCNDNEIEPQSENSDEYENYVANELTADYECFMEDIKMCNFSHCACIIEGKVGAWNGKHSILPVFCETLVEAIQKCMDNMDDVTITKNSSRIEVESHHRDGTNYFTIYILSPLGEDRYRRNGSVSMRNNANILTLPDSLF